MFCFEAARYVFSMSLRGLPRYSGVCLAKVIEAACMSCVLQKSKQNPVRKISSVTILIFI